MSELPKDWHNHEGYRQVFCAAVQGICANPQFGPGYQRSPLTAVEFAFEVLKAAVGFGGGSL